MGDGTGLAEALLGLDGFRVLAVSETPDELVVGIETTATVVGCEDCGTRAEAHDRVEVAIRDLPCFGRPARLVWRKRRWRCRAPLCERKTWTERSEHLDAQVVLTRRAGAEACRQVGELARPVVEGGRGVRRVLVDGHERRDRARLTPPRRSRPRRPCAPTGHRRDVVPGCQPRPRHHLRHRTRRPPPPPPHRHGRGQQCP
jgi:hypothetical protein